MSVWKVRAEGGSAPLRADAKAVYHALSLLADPEHGIQLQAAPSWTFRTFPGDDLDAMAEWVEHHSDATGIYYTLNVVPPDLKTSVRVGDIRRRRWLLIDLDRKKLQANKDLSATHEEHEQVRSLALEVRDWLDGQGWPAPLLVDSGNGFHLLYRVDLPNDADSRILLRETLKSLGERFDCERGLVGRECHDARRISKLPGTWARRGPNLPDRPWRMCQLLHAPEEPLVVPVELLKRVAEGGGKEPPDPSVNGNGKAHKPFQVRADSGADAAYARRALEYECGKMFLTAPGNLNNQIYRSAAALGNFVPDLLDENEVIDRLIAAARGAGCDNPPKDMDTLRRALEKGKTTPRKIPARTTGKQEPQRPKVQPKIYTLPDLLGTEFPPPVWVVPGLLSEGLTILAGKPKLGKSWLALNLALTVAAGGMALGYRQTEPGDVLYLSLEDRLRRVQDRARKVLAGLGQEASRRLHIAVEWERQDRGGLGDLHEWLVKVEQPRLVIVDVWTKFRPISTSARSAYDQDYEHVSALKSLLDQHSTSGIMVHHCKKGKAEDAIEEVSGTLGTAGATDGTLVLTRARTENDAELFVTGRDVEEQHLALEFDPKGFTWTCHGDAAERTESKLKKTVQDLLKANAGTPLTVLDIALQLKVPEEKRQYLRNVLSRLASDGLAERSGSGRYKWPVRPPDSVDTVPF